MVPIYTVILNFKLNIKKNISIFLRTLGKGPFTGFHGRLEKIPATLGLLPPT
jgi:hypothetical protein